MLYLFMQIYNVFLKNTNLMEEKVISEKEKQRRLNLALRFEEKRRKGFEKYIKRKRREIAKRKALDAKRKEAEKLKKKALKEKEKKKKKVGRPKKRGPRPNYYKRNKKRNIPHKFNPRRTLPPYLYKIVSCRNGVQNKFIGKYRNIEDAYEVFNKLKESDKNIIFPSMIIGLGALENAIDEYILIEKKENNDDITLLRNEYGKLVKQKTNLNNWHIIDKFQYKKEELFWVFGYNNRNDRKTFSWIYDNIVVNNINSPYDFKRIILFKNKIIIKDDNNNIDLILCKHYTDAVRFYNKLEEIIKSSKIKQILFSGDYSEHSDRRNKLIEELIKLTGWKRSRFYMKTNSFNKTNKKD